MPTNYTYTAHNNGNGDVRRRLTYTAHTHLHHYTHMAHTTTLAMRIDRAHYFIFVYNNLLELSLIYNNLHNSGGE